MMIEVTIKEFEDNFDEIIERVEDGEVFKIEDKAVLIKAEDYEEMVKNLPDEFFRNLPA